MPLIIPANSITGGYEVDNSLRFNDGSSDNLSRNTWGTATSDKIFTISVWVKRTTLGATQQIVNSYDGSTGNDNQLKFKNTDAIELTVSTSGAEYFLKTNRLFRDVSAWYHIVFAFDSTQGTDTNRYKLYVNGTQETSFSSVSYPPEDTTYQFFNNSNANRIGIAHGGSSEPFDGYMSEFVFIDGQQLDPTSFGEFDEDSGIWKPIDVSGLTFGTNGFYLDFENSGSLGADVSGNGNNFTVNNLTSVDQSTDTCTNNFCTLNPLDPFSGTLSEGNLKYNNGASFKASRGTFAIPSSGKWYFEVLNSTLTSGSVAIWSGVASQDTNISAQPNNGSTTGFYGIYNDSSLGILSNGSQSSSTSNTISANSILQFAIDADNNKLFVGIDNSYYSNATTTNGDPSAGTNPTESIDLTGYIPFVGAYSNTGSINFGSPPYTISSGNTDANGYGNFEYAVPSGYFALCSKNLAEYG
jgi:hypothetical protein